MRGAAKMPSWDQLYETAAAQHGLFTTKQAAEAGYSPQLLVHHLHSGNVTRLRRGIYRMVHFPLGENEELMVAWLWSEQAGVLSHQTALALHSLSDVLPARVHLTLPNTWRPRRLRPPTDVVLHHADVPVNERAWFGGVPITAPGRTLNDCANEGFSPELLAQAVKSALRRGIVIRSELSDVDRALVAYGGLGK